MSTIMPVQTRSQKSLSQVVNPPEKRRFSNLTNLKSPKGRKKPKLTTAEKNSITNYFSPLEKPMNGSVPSMQSPEVISTQAQDPVLQVPSESSGKVFSLINCIKKVLERNSKNVSERLQLQTVPSYLYDLQAFSNQQDVQFASKGNEYLAKNYIEEDRHIQFISFVRNEMCGRKEFPGCVVLRGTLDLILKISDESGTLCSSSQQGIMELYSLFTSIIATFPPPAACVQGQDTLRNSYLKLFQLPFKVYGIRVISPESGILQSMLDLLYELMFHCDTSKDVAKAKKQASDQEQQTNFWLWDEQKKEKSSFINFPRDEKFQRIFLVLDLLTEVFENDLAMFIIKYSNKLRSNIQNEKTCPLVCSVLWQRHESLTAVNSTIRSIITIFVNMIGLSYPTRNIQVVSRLLNLVSHVLNLYEYPEDSIEYPIYKNITLDLVREIQKTVENSIYYSMELIVKVAENMRSPLIQMLFVNQFLENIHKVSKPLSLEVPFDLIRKQEFKKFKNVQGAVVERDGMYPLHDAKGTSEPLEITQKGYLKLLRVFSGAVNSFYQIQAVVVETKKHELGGEEVVVSADSEPFDFAKIEEKLTEVDMNEKVKLRQVDMSFNKLVHIKLSKATCTFYVNQIKHFWLLTKLIKTCAQKYGDFMKLVDEMEAGV